jgi:hypothetical protein
MIFFLEIIWVKRKILKPISPTDHGGPPFPFLVLQQPGHISITKNYKPLSCKKNGKYVYVHHFSLELHVVQNDSKTKQK